MTAHLATSYSPSETALLLLDYHVMLLARCPSDDIRKGIISAGTTLLDAARAGKSPIVHSLISFAVDPAPTSLIYDRWMTSIKPTVVSNPEYGAEVEALRPDPAYAATGLEIETTKVPGVISNVKDEGVLKFLKEKGVKSLVIGGVSTSGAVNSTARDAADLGFVVTVVKEACWDPKEGLGETLLADVLTMTASVVDVEEAKKLFGRQ